MFGFFKPKLVEFGSGKFGILKRNFMGPNYYLGLDENWWCHPDCVEAYCFYETAEKALESYEQHLAAERLKKLKLKFKEIATLDDEWEF